MKDFEADLQLRLKAIRADGLYRALHRIDSAQGVRIQIAGAELLNFSSNDYLGLANHAALRKAAQEFGAGSGASRLICGSLAAHHDLETELAAFKGTEAALVFSTGYAAALGTISALIEKGDIVILDKLVHASIVDAARLSGAKLRVFAHNDLSELEDILKWTQNRAGSRVLIVTESVFSMDGDLALLRDIAELKDRFGAWLMLDEAHATGLFGQRRSGLAEAYELAARVEIHMGTLGKALGAAGGYIAGSRELVEFLINRARTFIFSTAPPPGLSAAAAAAVRLVQSAEGEILRSNLWARVDQVKNGLIGTQWSPGVIRSPIIPLMVGDENAAMQLAADLRNRRIFIPAVRYPTVARGQARLRLTVSAAHSADDISSLLDTLSNLTN